MTEKVEISENPIQTGAKFQLAVTVLTWNYLSLFTWQNVSEKTWRQLESVWGGGARDE